MRLAIVVSRFNEGITTRMREMAVRHAEERGAEVASVVEVPGAMELPLAVDRLLAQEDIDGAVALGAVVQGETRHDEVILHAVAAEIARIAVARGKPVGFGVTGPGMTWEQAEARIDYAARAVDAVIQMHALATGESLRAVGRGTAGGDRRS
jgi:6,7-dimethyl-8-ribityllumazine synthase